MGAIFRAPSLRDPRVVPTEPVEVDWTHPLAAALAIFVIPGVSANNLADGAGVYGPGSYVGAVSIGESPVGPCMNLTAGSGTSPLGVTLSSAAGPPNGDYSVFAIGAANSGQNFLGEQGATGSFDLSAQSQYRLDLTPVGGGNTAVTTYYGTQPSGDIVPGAWVACGGSATGFGCFAAIIGTSSFNWNNAIGPGQIGANATFDIGQRLDGYQNAIPQIALGAKWLRGLSTDECYWICAEPFAMLRPTMRRRYYVVSSGAVTLNPATGTLQVTGVAPTADIGVTVAPGLGTLHLAGVAPTAEIGVEVSPGSGTLSITGGTPLAQIGVTVGPAAGTITIAGATPTADIGVTVSPGAGTLDISGVAPAVEIGITEAPGAGTISLSGGTPTVTTGGTSVTISPPEGMLALDGGTPTAEIGIVIGPAHGTLALAGKTPTAEIGVSVASSAGTLDLAGVAPNVEIGVQVAPAAARLSLDGMAPTVLWDTVLSPADGVLTIAGATPTLVIGGNLIPSEIVTFSAIVDMMGFETPVDLVRFATPVDEVSVT